MKKIRVDTSRIDGRGIFADEFVNKGEKIQYIKGKKVKKVIRNVQDSKEIAHWIGVGKFLWINTEGTPFEFLNHSCEPNAAIIGTKTLVAIKNIAKDEEITIDYSMTDADPYWSIECTCGAENCRKIIQAVYSVPEEVFLKHMPHIPRYFQRAYIRKHIHDRARLYKSAAKK
ncbi:MAG TPA: SET domain-containing protein-lysine N-methyltransferase [Candidatus Paceibacterota bacterium]|nr:SET domain-containing protein-lysine N-methyltransferase [Candidatus Paceibacterota bacterium]